MKKIAHSVKNTLNSLCVIMDHVILFTIRIIVVSVDTCIIIIKNIVMVENPAAAKLLFLKKDYPNSKRSVTHERQKYHLVI